MDKTAEEAYGEIGIDGRAASILPELDYITLLGASVYCFDRCQSLIVELLRSQGCVNLDWWKLTDQTAGMICDDVKNHLDDKSYINPKLHDDFQDLCHRRDRIIHAFPCTDEETGEQYLRTKVKATARNHAEANKQFPITRDYMTQFIEKVTDFEYRPDDVRTQMRNHKDYKE